MSDKRNRPGTPRDVDPTDQRYRDPSKARKDDPTSYPVDPASSVGPRAPDTPTPDMRFAEAERFLAMLEKPPPPYSHRDDIVAWINKGIERAMFAGEEPLAIELLQWMQNHMPWPFSKDAREDLRGWFGSTRRELDQQVQERRAVAAKRQSMDAAERYRQLFKDHGWQ